MKKAKNFGKKLKKGQIVKNLEKNRKKGHIAKNFGMTRPRAREVNSIVASA